MSDLAQEQKKDEDEDEDAYWANYHGGDQDMDIQHERFLENQYAFEME